MNLNSVNDHHRNHIVLMDPNNSNASTTSLQPRHTNHHNKSNKDADNQSIPSLASERNTVISTKTTTEQSTTSNKGVEPLSSSNLPPSSSSPTSNQPSASSSSSSTSSIPPSMPPAQLPLLPSSFTPPSVCASINPPSSVVDFTQAMGMLQACSAVNQYWHWRLLGLMAEQQIAVMNCLKTTTDTTHHPGSHHYYNGSTQIRRRDGRCFGCGHHSRYLSRRERRRARVEMNGEKYRESDSSVTSTASDDDESIDEGLREHDSRRFLSTTDNQDARGEGRVQRSLGLFHQHKSKRRLRYQEDQEIVEKRPDEELSYWDQVVVSCELNHEHEHQLVNYLQHLSTLLPAPRSSQRDAKCELEQPAEPTTDDAAQSSVAETLISAAQPSSPSSTSQLTMTIGGRLFERSITATESPTTHDQQQSPTTPQRESHFREFDLTPSSQPTWCSGNQSLIYGGQPLLAQLHHELQSDIFSHAPPHYEHISAPAPTPQTSTSQPSESPQAPMPAQPQQRRRVPFNPPPNDDETQVPQHPLERFPFGIYVRFGVIMVILGVPTECLMLLGMVAGVHLSGGLDPFLNYLSSLEARWRNGHWLITNRRPLSQVLAELQQRRQLRRETAALVEQAQRILGQLHERAALVRATDNPDQVNQQQTTDSSAQIETASTTAVATTQIETSPHHGEEASHSERIEPSTSSSPSSSSSSFAASSSITVPFPNGTQQTINIPTVTDPSRVVVAPIGGRSHSLVILDAVPVPPSNRIEEWLMTRPLLRWMVVRLDWWVRWTYQLALALFFSLNPSWQPLTAFISDFPLLPALASAQAVSLISVDSSHASSGDSGIPNNHNSSSHHGNITSRDDSARTPESLETPLITETSSSAPSSPTHQVADSQQPPSDTNVSRKGDEKEKDDEKEFDREESEGRINNELANAPRSSDEVASVDPRMNPVILEEDQNTINGHASSEHLMNDTHSSAGGENANLIARRASSESSSSSKSVLSDWSESSFVETFGCQPPKDEPTDHNMTSSGP